MKIELTDLMKLKGEVKSLDDLRNYANNLNVKYSEEELKSVYDQLLELDLENITGGAGEIPGEYCSCKCRNCHHRILVYKAGGSTRCSKCGTLNTYKNAYMGC